MKAMLEARIVAVSIHGLAACRHGKADGVEARMTPSSQGCLSSPLIYGKPFISRPGNQFQIIKVAVVAMIASTRGLA